MGENNPMLKEVILTEERFVSLKVESALQREKYNNHNFGGGRMSKRLNVVTTLLVLASMVLASCGGGGGSADTAKLIKIATQSPLSGDMSAVGVDIKRGAELGVEQMGGALTDMGFKIELAPFDDQGNPDTGVANAKQIVSDPAILCVVGHYNSGVQIPSSEEYHNASLANVSPANTNPKVTTRGYLEVNRIVGRDDVQGVVGADFAIAQGMKSAFVVHDKTAYGQGIAEFFKQEAEKQGMEVLGFEGTEEKANFDALLSPILAANPDVVYFGGMYGQAAVLFKQAREKGYMGMFLSDDGFDSSDAAKIGGQALLDGAGTFYSTVSGPASVYPGTAKFIADFKAKYGSDPQPFAAQGYDSAGICLKAIEAAAAAKNGEMPTRAEVANAIRALKDYTGITGTVTFNSIGDPIIAKYFVIQVGAADPVKWSENPVVQTLDIAPPAP
jgi:branched-chain amino acid transport system substrate-binding protein